MIFAVCYREHLCSQPGVIPVQNFAPMVQFPCKSKFCVTPKVIRITDSNARAYCTRVLPEVYDYTLMIPYTE